MDYIIAILFGIIQGITEFLPVSSSGHLLIVHELLPNFQFSDELAFDVALHVGTLFAVVLFFWKDVVRYASAFFSKGTFTSNPSSDERLARNMLLAIIPAGVVGVFFEDIIENVFRSSSVVVVMLVLVALLFLLVERVNKERFTKTMADITWKSALFIGCMQTLALIPGTSRSGITMISGMMLKFTREQAARFSFLMSIPLIAGAGAKKGLDLVSAGLTTSEIPILIIGILSSGIVGYLSIKFLLQYVGKHTLGVFAWYRIILAVIVFIIL